MSVAHLNSKRHSLVLLHVTLRISHRVCPHHLLRSSTTMNSVSGVSISTPQLTDISFLLRPQQRQDKPLAVYSTSASCLSSVICEVLLGVNGLSYVESVVQDPAHIAAALWSHYGVITIVRPRIFAEFWCGVRIFFSTDAHLGVVEMSRLGRVSARERSAQSMAPQKASVCATSAMRC